MRTSYKFHVYLTENNELEFASAINSSLSIICVLLKRICRWTPLLLVDVSVNSNHLAAQTEEKCYNVKTQQWGAVLRDWWGPWRRWRSRVTSPFFLSVLDLVYSLIITGSCLCAPKHRLHQPKNFKRVCVAGCVYVLAHMPKKAPHMCASFWVTSVCVGSRCVRIPVPYSCSSSSSTGEAAENLPLFISFAPPRPPTTTTTRP